MDELTVPLGQAAIMQTPWPPFTLGFLCDISDAAYGNGVREYPRALESFTQHNRN